MQKHKRIIDANCIIRNPLIQLALRYQLITTRAAIQEIVDPLSKEKLNSLPEPIKVKQPCKKFVQNVIKFAKESGDFGSLSNTDIQLIALAAQSMYDQGYKQRLKAEPAKPRSQKQQEGQDQQESQQDQIDEDWQEGKDEGQWVTAETLTKLKQNRIEQQKEDQKIPALMTEDFAMQNVSLLIGIPIIAPSGRKIKEIKKYVIQCYACFKTVTDGDLSINRVCPGCGYLTLAKLSCSVNQDGEVIIHRKKGWRPSKHVQEKKQKALKQQLENKKKRRKGKKSKQGQDSHYFG